MGPNPLFLAGPTAAGKSGLAVALALRWRAEIVCADPFQLFAALPILTAQPGPELRAAVPHHLYGTVPPGSPMDAARYRSLAGPLIDSLVRAGRRVLVVGGSGLYLKALTHGLDPLPPPDAALRARLSTRPLEELARELCERDPGASDQIDLRNPRRVVRALEVCLLTGAPFTAARTAWARPVEGPLGILLDPPAEQLRDRIARRTEAMFEAGVEEEVRTAHGVGPSLAQAIGYPELRRRLAGEIDADTCRDGIRAATERYAKRQRTWFRKQLEYVRIEIPDAIAAEERLSGIR